MIEKIEKIAVIGDGAWGTTVADYLCRKPGNESLKVRLYAIDPDFRYAIASGYHKKTGDYHLHPQVSDNVTSDLETALDDADALFIAVPSQHYRDAIEKVRDYAKLKDGVIIINGTKGFGYKSEDNSLCLISDIVEETLICYDHAYVAFSGPNLSTEIRREEPTSSTAASYDDHANDAVVRLFNSESLSVYKSEDVRGVEVESAVKNVIAIATGMLKGWAGKYRTGWTLNNTMGHLLTRGYAEIQRVAHHFGAKSEALPRSSGIGDLIATAFSEDSRNFHTGSLIGKGKSLEQASAELDGQVAEGVGTTRKLYELFAGLNKIDLIPITEQVYQVLFEGRNVEDAIQILKEREPRID